MSVRKFEQLRSRLVEDLRCVLTVLENTEADPIELYGALCEVASRGLRLSRSFSSLARIAQTLALEQVRPRGGEDGSAH
jgi:hypothetical protein